MNPKRITPRLFAISTLIFGVGISSLSAGTAPIVASENTVRVPGAFGKMRRVHSTTLLLPAPARRTTVQQKRKRRSTDSQTTKAEASKSQGGEARADRKKEMDAELKSADPVATASQEKASNAVQEEVSTPDKPLSDSGIESSKDSESGTSSQSDAEKPAEPAPPSEQSGEGTAESHN